MSVEIVRSSDYPSGVRFNGPIFWFRVLSYSPGASIQLAGGVTIPLVGLEALPCRQNGRGEKVPWDFIEFGGTCVIEVAKDAEMPFPGAIANQAPLLGAQNDTVVSLGTGTVASVSGTLTALNDAVSIAATGNQYATAKFSVTTGGTATVTAEVSVDGGTNWVAAAYAKRTDAVSANPTVQSIAATALVTGQAWEVPLPGNATHFRLRCAGAGTTSAVALSGGALFVPGVPVVATLHDLTAAFAVAADSGVLDLGGWSSGILAVQNNDTGGTSRSAGIQFVADDGTTFNALTAAVGSGSAGFLMYGSALNFAQAGGILPRRGKVFVSAGTGTAGSSRAVLVARR